MLVVMSMLNDRMKRILVQVAVACIPVLLLPRPPARGEQESELRRTIAEWKQRRDQARSVRYQVSGEVIVPKGRWNKDPDIPADLKGKGDFPSSDYA